MDTVVDTKLEVKEEVVEQISFIDFQMFEKIFGIKITSMSFTCPKCGSTWGTKIYAEKAIQDLPQNKFICYHCSGRGGTKK
jgi:predicted RNA-binding Zn-ribbon protein involved in translation (DUF1610 family)